MTQSPDGLERLDRATFEFVTSVDAALDARRLLGRGGHRLDRIVDATAIVAGLALIALGQPVLGSVLVLAATAFLTLGPQLQKWLLARQARSMLGRRTTVTVDAELVRMEGDLGSVEVPWTSLTEVRADERTVILVRDRMLAGYIPSKAFRSGDEQAAFVRFAGERVAEAGKGRGPIL